MGKGKIFRRRFIIIIFIPIFILTLMFLDKWKQSIPNLVRSKTLDICSIPVTTQTITPLSDTKHLMVSAYKDQRERGYDVRIIGIFRVDSIQPLRCLFCCGRLFTSATPAKILQHPEYFGFPFVTTDVMCQIPTNCSTTHVSLIPQTSNVDESKFMWLPIRNQRTDGKEDMKLQFNFTVCISNLFEDYNNVLQFTQTLEMYRLLGVDRVKEGFVEIVPWPIHRYLKPSTGWLFSKHGGDVHYYGQMTTLNDCIYRSMARSRYVLLNDIDEIIIPYQHPDLMSMMKTLQHQHPNTAVFRIESHVFPKIYSEPSKKFDLPHWNGVPGMNILEYIYKEEPDKNIYHPGKMILQPKMVVQTSVHDVLSFSGQRYNVPPDFCHIIHVRFSKRGLPLEQLHEDKRLWDFHEQLIPNVDRVLKNVGMLRLEEHS
uniref:Glycosyltransferase family 92 protein n=1 Tax=Sphaeramia orbicularis TaxID=375764 RepID=A0A672Z2G1_9TELE